VSDEDCPLQLACNTIPAALADGAAAHSPAACSAAVAEVDYRMDSPLKTADPGAETARSFAPVVATLGDESLLVAPGGRADGEKQLISARCSPRSSPAPIRRADPGH
jgi:hypothetical protein